MSHLRLAPSFRNMAFRTWAVLVSLALLCLGIHTFFLTQDMSGSLCRLDTKARELLDNNNAVSNTGPLSSYNQRPNHREGDLGEDTIVIYNRVPKTGSTSFEGILYQLSISNNFHSIHFNTTRFIRYLGLADQRKFITNITNWHEMKPAVYHGHLTYIDFSRFGLQQVPIYINMVREPLSRLISHYYFLRYGDDFSPAKVRSRANDMTTFDECVAKDGWDCGPSKMWVQIPFFCGHAAECTNPGSSWALEEAKRNLVNHYLVVGITERLPEFLAVLEAALPRFFHGATEAYERGATIYLRKTVQKVAPSEATLDKMERSLPYRMEREFYQFAIQQFDFSLNRTLYETQPQKFSPKSKIFAFGYSAQAKFKKK